MNIYRQELKVLALPMVYWTLGMLFFVLLFMLVYPPVAADVRGFEAILANFPPELRKALGVTTLNLARLLDFFAFIFVYILLIGAVFAMKSGLMVLSEEGRSKTADFLLSKPVSRPVIVTAKITAVFSHLLLQSALLILFSYFIIQSYGTFSLRLFLFMVFSLIQIQLIFASLGFFLAALLRRIKSVLPVALGVVFAFFLMQMINQSVNDPWLAYFTPFAYFDPASIIMSEGYHPSMLVVNLLLSTLLISLSYFVYRKKDFAAQ